MLNPQKLKGIGALAASYGIYSYLPYIAVSLGSTIPVVAACAAGLYGMLAFAEQQKVNTIEVIKDGNNEGRLRINVANSAFSSRYIIADVKDVHSVVSLHNDDLGEDDLEGNIISVARYTDESTGKEVTIPLTLTLSGDAFRDKAFLDWIIAEKGTDETTSDDFNDLLYR